MSRRRLHLLALGSVTTALAFGLLAEKAEASVVIDIYQKGGDVEAAGTGTIDLTDLVLEGFAASFGTIAAINGIVLVGPVFSGPPFPDLNVYGGASGPASFGSGGANGASVGSGVFFGVFGVLGRLGVPIVYASGTPLSGSSTWNGQTLASLGLTPGTYVYTWGTGADADSLTVNIKGVPEPSTWAMMVLGFIGLALGGYRASRRKAVLASEPA